MYARFYRWASDRINGNGIVAFITNRSFIDSRTFDGFRKSVAKEFDYLYIVDLQGDIRANSGQAKANVFNIMTGVAIAFFIRKEQADTKYIKYYSVDFDTANEKLDFLRFTPLRTIAFENIQADKNNNWINIADTDFQKLLPCIDKQNKLAKSINNNEVLFYKYSNGTVTNRDEWVFDFDKEQLKKKINYFFKEYNAFVSDWKNHIKSIKNFTLLKPDEKIKLATDFVFSKEVTIKWSGRLFRDKLLKQRTTKFKSEFIRIAHYRPFTKKYLYSDYIPIDIQGQLFDFLPKNGQNKIISINQSKKEFNVLSSDSLIDLHFNGDSVCIPLYRYNTNGTRLDNITDWGLKQFTDHYKDKTITKEDVFNYTYAVFHNPEYVTKYELNLKREFPRVPFYNDFWKWANWGKTLMDLHIGYENVEPYELKVISEELKEKPKTKLKALPENGEIQLDENTSITNIPDLAWEYKFGNRSALHWIVDQYKEKNIDDKTIAEKFNSYKFADYKELVIDLIKRVTTVSVRTMEIVNKMVFEDKRIKKEP